MGSNERRPGGRALTLGCGRYSVASKNVADRLITDLIPQIGQRPHNPVIAPVTVLLGHANDQLLKSSADPGSAWTSTRLRAIEFAGDELAVPSQDGVRSGYIRHLAENFAT